MDELKGLGTDKWYRALAVLSVALVVGAAALGDDAELRKTLILGGTGGVLVGLGQWMDHPFQTRLLGGNLKAEGYPHQPSIGGTLLTLAGAVIAGRAIWLLW